MLFIQIKSDQFLFSFLLILFAQFTTLIHEIDSRVERNFRTGLLVIKVKSDISGEQGISGNLSVP